MSVLLEPHAAPAVEVGLDDPPSCGRRSLVWSALSRHRRHRASRETGTVEMICSRGHSAAFMPSIAAAPALMRGMSSLPNSVASFIGSKPRMRNELIPSR